MLFGAARKSRFLASPACGQQARNSNREGGEDVSREQGTTGALEKMCFGPAAYRPIAGFRGARVPRPGRVLLESLRVLGRVQPQHHANRAGLELVHFGECVGCRLGGVVQKEFGSPGEEVRFLGCNSWAR